MDQIKKQIKQLTVEEMLELNTFLIQQIRFERSLVAQKMKRQLFVGSAVNFENNDGVRVTGTVKKVMRKFAKVETSGAIWRVPLSHLSKGVA